MNFKHTLSILFISFYSVLFSQEVDHEHSIHHAFLENKGQWNKEVLFKAKFSGGNLWIQQKKLIFQLQDYSEYKKNHGNLNDSLEKGEIRQSLVHLNFIGSNEVNSIEKKFETKTFFNFFIGNDQSKWASNAHGYGETMLRDLYPGIDLKLIEEKEQLKYEFHVLPNVNPEVIKLSYSGQDKLSIDKKGNLNISTQLGKIIEQKPYSYQIINGRIIEVECAFELKNDIVEFKLGNYSKDAILVIDPVLVFATYSGSITDNFGMTATYGYDGTAYSGGTVFGNAYPTPDNNAFDVTGNFTAVSNPTYGITDVFLSKYSSDGTTMIWTTFLGGGDQNQGTETVNSLICDKLNNLYVYGATSSIDFPIQSGYQTSHAGGVSGSNYYQNGVYFTNQGTDIYVAKISSNGQSLLGSTYIGGASNDGINYKITSGVYSAYSDYDSLTPNYGDQFRGEIMLDQNGNCLVASCSRSLNFPIVNGIQSTIGGNQDGVVFKLSPDLSNLIWSTYYGGSNNDACYSVKIDSSYNVVIAGGTSSNDLNFTAGGWQSTYNGGKTDGFVLKLNPTGLSVVQATYIGTSQADQSFFAEIDRNDNVFLLGLSAGGTFPVINAGYVNPGSCQFIIKLDPSLTSALNSTVFGNGSATPNISPSAFLVDICGNIYVSGWGAHLLQSTQLDGMPVTANAFLGTPPDGFDFYLFVLQREFQDILYATYLGGSPSREHVDGGTSRFDKNGVVYQSVCGGCWGNSDFPTTPNAWSNFNLDNDGCNNLIFKFDFQLIPNAEFTADQTLGCATFNVVLDNFSTASDSYLWDFGNGDTSSVIFNPSITYDTPGIYEINLYVTDSICLLTDTATISITVFDSLQLSVSDDVDLCVPEPLTLTANSFGTASSFIWSSNINFSDTLNTSVLDSVLNVTPSGSTTFYCLAGNLGCRKVDSVVVTFISSDLIITANDSICIGEIATVTATNLNPIITFTYAWTPDSIIVTQTASNVVQTNPTVSQYVYVTASASNGCEIKDSIFIAVSSIGNGLVIASADPTSIPSGGTTILSGSPSGLNYTWSPTVGVTNPTMQSTSAQVYESTIYTLKVTDGICTKSDTVLVKVFTFICGEPFIYVPNAFSPNGDGENDVLYVRGELIEGMLFRIFDRWGELVFESTDRTLGWDGTFRDKKLDPDVYDYYLKATCVDGNESIVKGNITLMK